MLDEIIPPSSKEQLHFLGPTFKFYTYMSKFIYEEDDIQGLRIINPIEKIIERNDRSEYTNTELVKTLSDLATRKHKTDDLSKVFDQLAICLLRQTIIETTKESFYLREVEFYYFDKDSHPDSYAHNNKRQLTFGEWYFHRFTDIEPFMKSNRNGIDITFGNEQEGIYGGVLIRKIENAATGELFVGINKVVKELIRNVGEENVNQLAHGSGQFAFDRKHIMRLEKDNHLFSSPIFKSPRNGLTFRNEEQANKFHKAAYCYFNHDSNITEVRSEI